MGGRACASHNQLHHIGETEVYYVLYTDPIPRVYTSSPSPLFSGVDACGVRLEKREEDWGRGLLGLCAVTNFSLHGVTGKRST